MIDRRSHSHPLTLRPTDDSDLRKALLVHEADPQAAFW